ncbi:hydantoinase/oxoprolinase family protein [Lipingzhangella sp. LS1_29]|uniref:Hydantoinase/oxoprolinase family protein n=1 Tax=Lipingzhangella rawalii TaxID=2055835 RepID=A0ABU2H7S9_9ACTN|nr:hydantoinase/oxoprolinase family protein [Lipingzhangella rawalii]MDS1271361.1 hydantoinase/oxoprolinase family protein [Lipingzhangella rawalii]
MNKPNPRAHAPRLRIGIDVGGTNTDAVVLREQDPTSTSQNTMTAADVLARTKVATSADITSGVTQALRGVLADPTTPERAGAHPHQVARVMIGTTHATNAVLQRNGLRRVAVLRIGAPASTAIRPMFGWPPDLCAQVDAGSAIVRGGVELDGSAAAAFDTEAVSRFCATVAERAEAIAVCGVFSPAAPDQERHAAEVIRRELGDIPVSMSHELGSLGLLERENTTILNAALGGVATHLIDAIRAGLDSHDLGHAIPYFAQNDGTLLSLEETRRAPVLTIGSGPANSLRGAAMLTGEPNALVVDVGGTSADVGALTQTFPRESAFGVEVGGVATNFRMPDLVSIAIGGGTVVRFRDEGPPTVGPDSVGYRLAEEALVFGGATPTLSDAAVAAGRGEFGDRSLLPGHLSLSAALEHADAEIADAIDRIKSSGTDLPLIAVGGGSVLVPDTVPGTTGVLRPAHHDVANAIGAAIGTVSGNVDRIVEVGQGGASRTRLIDDAREAAVAAAVRAGADPSVVEVVEIDEIPLSYLREPAVRLRVKAAGPLAGTND